MISVLSACLLLASGAQPVPPQPEQSRPNQSKEVRSEEERLNAVGDRELALRERQEPEAIREVAKDMRLSSGETEQVVEWQRSFLESCAAICPPASGEDPVLRGRKVGRLRRSLIRRERNLLGDHRFYEFSKRFAHAMNKCRWANEGQVFPESADTIKAQ